MGIAYEAELNINMIKQAKDNKVKWLKENGFSAEGLTHVYWKPDSYDRRQDLKNLGFRFSKELLWHIAEVPSGMENDCIDIYANNIADFYAWGGAFLPNTIDIVRAAIKKLQPRPESNSTWLDAELGERFRNLPCKVLKIKEFQGLYGWSQIVTFETENQEELTWFTATELGFKVNDKVSLAGTVKKFSDYNGIKTTIVTRCKYKVEESE